MKKSKQTFATAAYNSTSESFKQLNPEFFKHFGVVPVNYPMSSAPSTTPILKEGKRIRQGEKPLNKLELSFQSYFKATTPNDIILAQAIRFRLANGIWYKADFVTINISTGKLSVWEVKGPHAFRGGYENLKVAASQYPWFTWNLVWQKDREWIRQQIIPGISNHQ